MTKRNIAIANFNPSEVEGSNWPRFIGWKMVGNPVIESGLFGLIDKDVRMHRFFKDTTIEEIIRSQLRYTYSQTVTGLPRDVIFHPQDGGVIIMNLPGVQDFSIRWLPPYQYIDKDLVEWDVYVLIKGHDIHIDGDFHHVFKSDGYWDMGIWKPKFKIGEQWNDIQMIEQATINYVVASGYPAMRCKYSSSAKDGYEYEIVDVYQEIPGYQA